MTKDEARLSVMSAISMSLKDPTLQQGFEIICKNLSELEKQNKELQEENKKLKNRIAELEGIKDVATLIKANNSAVVTLMQLNNKLVSANQQIENMKCCGNCKHVGDSGVMGCFCYKSKEYTYPHTVCDKWEITE